MARELSLTTNEIKVLSSLLSEDRYGLEIIEVIQQAGGSMLMGSLYNILRRLERNGFVKSYWKDGKDDTHERGGNRRRYYEITGAGEMEVRKVQGEFGGLWGWNLA